MVSIIANIFNRKFNLISGTLLGKLDTLVLFVIGFILLIVPQWVNEELMFPTQSGKFFVFIVGVIALSILLAIPYQYSKIQISKITYLDIALTLFVIYQVFRTRLFLEIIFYEYLGLIIFYMAIRTTSASHTK
jgi:hypothetical protein